MNNFEFYNPTRIIFGAGSLDKIGSVACRYGKKALVVTTRGSVQRLGILGRVKRSLDAAGMDSVDFFGVGPNPRLDTVMRGVAVCRREHIDLIVAVGGGSVIDCAKAIAFCVSDDGDPWDFFTGARKPLKALPICTVLTLSGTGSEMNANCVITNEALAQKYVMRTPVASPKASIIDPALMVSVPKYLTACGMADTISHVMEKYFSGTPDTPLQDRISEGVILTVLENAFVLDTPGDIAGRANLAWAAAIALNDIPNVGRAGTFDVHTIEHEVSAKYDVAHGAGLAVIHPAWMRHLCRKNPEKFVQFARRIFDIDPAGRDSMDTGLAGINALSRAFCAWGLPATLNGTGRFGGGFKGTGSRRDPLSTGRFAK